MDILRDETVLALIGVDWENGEVSMEAIAEARRRGLLRRSDGEDAQ